MQQSIDEILKIIKSGIRRPVPAGDYLQLEGPKTNRQILNEFEINANNDNDYDSTASVRGSKRIKTHHDIETCLPLRCNDLNPTQTPIIDQITTPILPTLTSIPTYTGFTNLKHPHLRSITNKLFRSPIRANSQRPGILYLYTRPSDPDHVKIGSTFCTSTTRRHSEIRSRCKYTPHFKMVVENVMFAGRVEMLIHRELELMGVRRCEVVCRYGGGTIEDSRISNRNEQAETQAHSTDHTNHQHEPEDQQHRELDLHESSTTITDTTDSQLSVTTPTHKFCRGNHREWFFIRADGPDGAIPLIKSWTDFFAAAQPYSPSSGKLKPEWVNKLITFPFRDRLLRVSVLWTLWAEMQFAMEIQERQFGLGRGMATESGSCETGEFLWTEVRSPMG